MKVVRTDRKLQTPIVDAALRGAGHELVLLPDGTSERELVSHVRDADLLLTCYQPVTRAVVEAATRLKGIVKYGVGVDAIDIPAASGRGIPVVNVPEYAERTVAECAIALMMALARRLPPLLKHMDEKGWAWPEPAWMGSDIAGQTVGIIGLGRTGRSFARIAGAGFQARVLAHDPYVNREEMHRLGVMKIDRLEDLLRQADFVSVHAVLNDETRHLLGRNELGQMKRSAFLINVSRGEIIDEHALLSALQDGRIAGAGLDVFGLEPLDRNEHPLAALYDMPNVIMTPHLAFYTMQAMERLEREVLERCLEVLEARPVTVKSDDPRLRGQRGAIRFE